MIIPEHIEDALRQQGKDITALIQRRKFRR
jgi:hypothetical protein